MHPSISYASTNCTLPSISDLFSLCDRVEQTPMSEGMHFAPSLTECQPVFRPNYYHQPLKAKRKRASPSQLSVLNRVFSQTYFPSTELRIELGKQLGMSSRTVQIWFQNKRQSLRARNRQARAHQNQHRIPQMSFPPASPTEEDLVHYCRDSMSSLPSRISLPPLRLTVPIPQPPLSPTWSAASSTTSSSPSLASPTTYPSPISIDALLYRD